MKTRHLSNTSIVSICIALITFYIVAITAHLTASSSTTFEWTHFGIYAFCVPFLVGFGVFTGKMIADKYCEKSDIFRASMTMATLAAIVAVLFAILFVAAYFANSFPKADYLLFGIYGLVAWLTMIPSATFASQWTTK